MTNDEHDATAQIPEAASLEPQSPQALSPVVGLPVPPPPPQFPKYADDGPWPVFSWDTGCDVPASPAAPTRRVRIGEMAVSMPLAGVITRLEPRVVYDLPEDEAGALIRSGRGTDPDGDSGLVAALVQESKKGTFWKLMEKMRAKLETK